jgi:hypothetical protein
MDLGSLVRIRVLNQDKTGLEVGAMIAPTTSTACVAIEASIDVFATSIST